MSKYLGTHELVREPYAGRAPGSKARAVRRSRKTRAKGHLVPNATLRDAAVRAVEQDRVTWADLGVAIGGSPRDGERVKRMLGVVDQKVRDGDGRRRQENVRDDFASKLCLALDIYPRDLGL